LLDKDAFDNAEDATVNTNTNIEEEIEKVFELTHKEEQEVGVCSKYSLAKENNISAIRASDGNIDGEFCDDNYDVGF